MILLTSTSDVISVVTSSAANTDVHASWLDNLTGVITPSRTNTASISSATTTTIVAAPAVSTQRNVKTITIRNRHASTSQDVTVKHTDGTNNLELIKVTLAAGEELIYTDAQGWTQFLASGAVKTGFDPNAVAITGGTISGVTETLAAGTTSVAPLKFTTSASVVTAPAGGEIEYDGLVHYTSHIANARGANVSEQFIFTPVAGFTLQSQTAAQKMFGTPTNGALTVNAATTYQFECVFDLTTMGASGAFGWALGGTAAFTTLKWYSIANKAVLATQLAWQSTFNATAANTAICAATAATVGAAFITGVMRISTGGTVIPQISLGTAAAAVVQAGSYFRAWPVGTNTVASVGNWS